MQIHVFEIASPHPRVQRELYTALELLRVCDQKAGLALELIDGYVTPPIPRRAEWDKDDMRIDDIDINEVQAVCRVNSAILEQIATGVPAIPDSAFAVLLAFENRCDLNPPHVEGINHLLELATRHLQKALDLSAEHDGNDIDDSYRLLLTVFLSVRSCTGFLECLMRGAFQDDVIALILAGKPVPAYARLRLDHIKERFPSGTLRNGEPAWTPEEELEAAGVS